MAVVSIGLRPLRQAVTMSSKTTKERGVIVAVISDVFFGITVRNTIKRLNYEPQMIKSALLLPDTVAVYDPSLVIVDLGVVAEEASWDLITAIREKDVPVLVFGPHKDVEGLRAAKQAGVSRVVANSQFHREMPVLIERYVRRPEEVAKQRAPERKQPDLVPEPEAKKKQP